MKKEKQHKKVEEPQIEMPVEDIAQNLNEQIYIENEETIEQYKEKCADLADKNLRLMAEFDNFRKRTLKEKSDLIISASEKVLVDLLPLVDDFERAMKAMENTEDINAIKEGETLIYNKLIAFLQSQGVKEIATENQNFDVDLHEAVTTFPTADETQKGKIIDTVSKGYTLNDKVIRFPKVVVGE